MAAKKTALITGITGQDGSSLAKFLLKKGYSVAGIVRKTSSIRHENIDHIQENLNLIQADLLDPVSIREAIQAVKPDEIYNLASQSAPTKLTPSANSVKKLIKMMVDANLARLK